MGTIFGIIVAELVVVVMVVGATLLMGFLGGTAIVPIWGCCGEDLLILFNSEDKFKATFDGF